MNTDTTGQPLRPKGSRRPLGVWILTLFHFVLSAYWIFRISPGLSEPLPHGWDEASVPFTWFALALYAGIIVSVLGAWFGSAGFRNVFLALLTVVSFLFIREDYMAIVFFLVRNEMHVDLPPSSRLGLLMGPLVPALWLAIQYWYFLGRRTQSFYRKTRDSAVTNH